MAEVNLDELEVLEKAATSGPWYHMQPGEPCSLKQSHFETYDWLSDHPVAGLHRKIILQRGACYGGTADYALIAALRNAAPALLAEVRQLREHNQRLSESLEEMLCQYGEAGPDAGWRKRLHDAARAALAGEVEVPHV